MGRPETRDSTKGYASKYRTQGSLIPLIAQRKKALSLVYHDITRSLVMTTHVTDSPCRLLGPSEDSNVSRQYLLHFTFEPFSPCYSKGGSS